MLPDDGVVKDVNAKVMSIVKSFNSSDAICIAGFGVVNVVWTAPDPSTQRERLRDLDRESRSKVFRS
jgi:hypothetical protein